jgi:hypothetical protein
MRTETALAVGDVDCADAAEGGGADERERLAVRGARVGIDRRRPGPKIASVLSRTGATAPQLRRAAEASGH